jgi:azurin
MKPMKSLIKTATLLLFACTLALPVFSSGIQEDVRTIEVTGMDNLKYDKTLIEVSPGETIRLVFKVESNVPPQAMSHNIAILPQGMDADTFAMASMGARDNEYIAPDYEDQLIAYTEMIGGGEISTVEFTVPETAGDYDYICTFPGHYQGGMVGILRVK